MGWRFFPHLSAQTRTDSSTVHAGKPRSAHDFLAAHHPPDTEEELRLVTAVATPSPRVRTFRCMHRLPKTNTAGIAALSLAHRVPSGPKRYALARTLVFSHHQLSP